jgi:hypothetical protein
MAKQIDCFARALGDCFGVPSKEHYVTEGGLELLKVALPGAPRVYEKKKGVRRLQEIGKLYARILCEKHNSGLSEFDQTFIDMMLATEAISDAVNAGDQTPELFQIDGDRFERWMLKTLIGGLYSGEQWPDLAAFHGNEPSMHWLEVLYRRKDVPRGQGFFWQPTEMKGLTFDNRDEFEVLPWMSNQTVIGLHAWFFGFHFALLVENLPPGLDLGAYRPAGLKIANINKRISFKWKNGWEAPEITVGR